MTKSALPFRVDKRANLSQQFCLCYRGDKLISGRLNFLAEIPSHRATEELLAKIRSNNSVRKSTEPAYHTSANSLGSHGRVSGAGANFIVYSVLIYCELPWRSS
jgi:hypothetical protein